MAQWTEKQAWRDLLIKLVRFPSITGTQAERDFPHFAASLLASLPYFHHHPEHLQLFKIRDDREFLLAMVAHPSQTTRDTVILLSHFDVVDIRDYGSLTHQAFEPDLLTEYLTAHPEDLPLEVRADLKTGDWMFGRGIMDMKAGLAIEMALMAEAAADELPANLLLLSVPDEEVNSVGMQDALATLLSWQKVHHLRYVLLLNAEPIFPKFIGDPTQYISTGSIGKVLPGFFCYGKETHVGESLSGLNANYMAAQLTRILEWNPLFSPKLGNQEPSSPPTNLYQRSLKESYSVQTPYRAVTLTNLLIADQSLTEVVDQLLSVAQIAADEIVKDYFQKTIAFFDQATPPHIRVTTYQQLRQRAMDHYGEEFIRSIEAETISRTPGDERDRSIAVVDQIARLQSSEAPMIVLFFAPPFYPAVNSSDHPRVSSVLQALQSYALSNHHIKLEEQRYFGGLSDLSFGGSGRLSPDAISILVDNLPLWQRGYELPIDAMQQFEVPVLNVGPWGRDAHKWTERLHMDYAYHVALDLVREAVRQALTQDNA